MLPRPTIPLLLLLAATTAGCSNTQTISADQIAPNATLARRENDRAFALIQQGKHDEALPILNKAVQADVMYGPARNNLGLVYFKQGKLYQAAWEFQNAIKLMPYQPEPRSNLGQVMEAAGKFTEAADSYQQARKMEPDNPEYIGNLARVRLKQGQRDGETRDLLQELVLKDPRPAWNDWAREQLMLINARPPKPAP
jgi:Flp pilus assembly protein TadD